MFDDLDTYPRVLDALMASGELDAAILVGSFGTMTHEEPGRLDETVAAAKLAAAGHPLVAAVQWIDEPPWRALRDGGVPAFRRVGSACRALAAAHRFATADVRVTPDWPAAAAPVPGTGYMAARALLQAGGVPFADAAEVASADEAVAAAGRIGYPVVLKALGAEHKSDGGGVVLGLGDARRRWPPRSPTSRRGCARRRSASSAWSSRPSRPSWSAA